MSCVTIVIPHCCSTSDIIHSDQDILIWQWCRGRVRGSSWVVSDLQEIINTCQNRRDGIHQVIRSWRSESQQVGYVMCIRQEFFNWRIFRTSSKATTKWPLQSLLPYLPKVLHREIQNSRYYVASSNSLRIDSDTHRNQTKNKEDTHERLFEEIKKLYAKTVPGVTAPETRKKIEAL